MALLQQLIPPFRYAIVEEFLFRGAYPTIKNYRFLRRLHLKTIVSLTPEPHPNRDMREFCEYEGITNRHFYVDKFQDGVTLSNAKVIQILQVIIRPENLPLYLHCLDGTHVTGLVIMCFRKLQSWNLSTSTAEFCSFQKSGEISREESQFVEAFRGDVEIPPVIPTWLWQGVRTVKHPTFRLRLLPSPATEQKEENATGRCAGDSVNNTSTQASTLNVAVGAEDHALESLGRHLAGSGLCSPINPLLKLTNLSNQGGADLNEGDDRALFHGQARSSKVTGFSMPELVSGDEVGTGRGAIVYRAPKSERNATRRVESSVLGFSHAGWGMQYTEQRRNLEALSLEGLRVVGPVHSPNLRQSTHTKAITNRVSGKLTGNRPWAVYSRVDRNKSLKL